MVPILPSILVFLNARVVKKSTHHWCVSDCTCVVHVRLEHWLKRREGQKEWNKVVAMLASAGEIGPKDFKLKNKCCVSVSNNKKQEYWDYQS
jgi:hypothetical protein